MYLKMGHYFEEKKMRGAWKRKVPWFEPYETYTVNQ